MKPLGEMFEEALRCKTKEEADAWFLREVQERGRESGKSDKEVAAIVLDNLGYFSGYYSLDVARRIFELFGARHPYFGTPDERAALSPEEIFKMGENLARTGKARP